MPAVVERLPDLPVILVKYSNSITVEDMQAVFAQSLQLITPNDGVMYRVVQIEDLDSNFADILHIAQLSASDTPGATSDSRFRLILVGHDEWTKLYIQMMNQQQFGKMSIPCFVTLDQALEYVHTAIAPLKG